MNVLAVDDDVLVLRTICAMLNKSGLTAYGVGSIPQALEAWALLGPSFALVLTEEWVKDEDGLILAEAAQAERCVPVLVTSARGRCGDNIAARAPVAFLSKPFTLTEMRRAVKNLLEEAKRRPSFGQNGGERLKRATDLPE